MKPLKPGVIGMEPEAFLIDLDGVLSVGGAPVPGAIAAISYLRENGYPFRFVSNTTRKSRVTISRQLESMGFEIPVSHIFTPSMAAVSYVTGKAGTDAAILTTPDVSAEIVRGGIQNREDSPRFVIVGDGGDLFGYSVLNKAFRLIMGGAELIALEKDRYWMGDDGLMLSAGPFVAALEFATGTRAAVMGKPSREFFMRSLASMNADPARTVMIGDDIITDIGGAAAAGLSGILVRTGKFRQEALAGATVIPKRIISSIAELPRLLSSGELCPDQ
ncbi:MAG: TIGR01458 family HAD-type hydrolase [Methanomicrobiales archaeon]|jgi:HAD superfamily hydrolase (TIGR01458 family)|nr:TIGR01458 family HAD-type hydrolase [Methanomicrobiales archaeon]